MIPVYGPCVCDGLTQAINVAVVKEIEFKVVVAITLAAKVKDAGLLVNVGLPTNVAELFCVLRSVYVVPDPLYELAFKFKISPFVTKTGGAVGAT